MSILVFLLSAIYVLACLFLIFVVLIQKGEGGGLGALGGGGVETAFGAKADMTWKRATFVAAGIYVTLALLLGVMPGWRPAKSVVFEQPKDGTAPVDSKK
jgi:preprotein translocase subunit SecG